MIRLSYGKKIEDFVSDFNSSDYNVIVSIDRNTVTGKWDLLFYDRPNDKTKAKRLPTAWNRITSWFFSIWK